MTDWTTDGDTERVRQADDRGAKKQLWKEHPSGWLYLTQHDGIPILVDALLDLLPNREFNKTELAEHAGVTRQTVGNYTHDNEAGDKTLYRRPGIHFGAKTMILGQGTVRISRLDYGAGEFSGSLPEADANGGPSIFAIHETPYPAVDDAGSPIHRNDPNHLDLREFLDRADEWPNLIVSGHMHVGSRGSIAGYDTPLLVTGPTAGISTSTQENRPSTWLLTIFEGEIQIERTELT